MTQRPNRKKMRRQAYMIAIVVLISAFWGVWLVAQGVLPEQYVLTEGEEVSGLIPHERYDITTFAKDLAAPRYLITHPTQNTIFLSERGAGRVLALQDTDDNRIADAPVVVVDGLVSPSGLAFYQEWLYVAQADRITRYRLSEDLTAVSEEVVVRNLPVGRNPNEVESGFHALLVDPQENDLYVTISASCAACEQNDSRRATVMVYNLDGSNERIFARGVYRALGLAFNPITGELWAGVQGRPQANNAPEMIYKLQNGDDLGWYQCIAGEPTSDDPDIVEYCETVREPLATFNPQGNITTLEFLTHPDIPESLQGDLLVILHGGVREDGFQQGFGVFTMDVSPTGSLESEELNLFVDGFWLSDEPGDLLGRPFDAAVTPNGDIYISDDAAGTVYQMRLNS